MTLDPSGNSNWRGNPNWRDNQTGNSSGRWNRDNSRNVNWKPSYSNPREQNICYYHEKFGERAFKCEVYCKYYNKMAKNFAGSRM